MDHNEWKQWMTEASSLLDGMDSEVTERVPDWATFRATFTQAGGAAETLQAETAAAQQQLAAAYRTMRQLPIGPSGSTASTTKR